MKNATKMGSNRTGLQMSPIDAKRLLENTAMTTPPTGGPDLLMALRGDYIDEAGVVGTVPPPGTVTGVVKSGAEMLTGDRPQVLIDKLGERLAFERGGTRLYDALLAKCGGGAAALDAEVPLDVLERFRHEEAAHALMLAAALEKLGADPTAMTPCADLVGVESQGLMQAITDPRTTLSQSLHAMLVAELADHQGWQLLIALAEQMGHDGLAHDCRTAFEEEERHLASIRAWVVAATLELAEVG
jgi:hypothetical protein